MNFLSKIIKRIIKNERKVVVRFPPSPTGFLHVGTARTALFNYLFAKSRGGEMIFRFEDTDKERSKKEFEEDILEGLKWLGIKYDGEIGRQSERTEVYKKYLNEMIEKGVAYEAEENKDGTGKIIRFKNPNEKIKFRDLIRGDIEFDTTELLDFVIAKDKENPLYHLTVVVDDFESGVTHIIRGEDGISNTPRQILLQRAIGANVPEYAHLPLILGHDKSKLSKRHGAVSVNEYKKLGYLPEAMINFLATIGWNSGDDRELFSMEELIKDFSLDGVQKSGAIFNEEKLDWVNKEYLKKLPINTLEDMVKKHLDGSVDFSVQAQDEMIKKIAPIILERINKFSDIDKMISDGELGYYFEKPEYEKEKLVWKDSDLVTTKENIEKVIDLIEDAKVFDAEDVKKLVWGYAEERGKGAVLWPMRFALSGQQKSPDPFTLAGVLGKAETVARLKIASEKLAS